MRVDAVDESATVRLQLGLARTPRADATGLLGERPPGAAQSRQPVLQEGQFHLRLALGSAGVLREDVEDHRGAVDGRSTEDLLQVALLGRREVVLEDDGVGVDREADLAQFLHLARPEERGGIGRVTTLDYARDDVGARGVDQERQLVELVVEFVLGDARELDADEHDLLADACDR